MTTFDEKGKLVIPAKGTQPVTEPPVEVGSTEALKKLAANPNNTTMKTNGKKKTPPVKVGDTTEAMTKLLDKKEKTTTEKKKTTTTKAKSNKDHPHVKDPGYWKWYYNQPGVKQKYLAWSKAWRLRKAAEKKAAEKKSTSKKVAKK